MTVVYIDVLVIENFIINYLLLFASAKLAGERAGRLRMAAAAALGALYAAAVFFPGFKFLTSIFIKIAVGCLMGLITFGRRKRLLRHILIFFFVSFAFAGCALFVGFLTGGGVMQNGVYMPIGVQSVAISLLVSFCVLTPVFSRLAKHGGLKRDTVSLNIALNGKELHLTALIDSGNTLSDPITGYPVIVAELDSLRPLLSGELCTKLRRQGAVAAFEDYVQRGLAGKMRLIPYRTVGSDCTFLLAVKPERIMLGGKELKGALLGISVTELSDGGAYTALAGIY